MQEHSAKPLSEVAYVFLGDAGNNIGDSLMIGGAMMGMDVRLCAPQVCWPNQGLRREADDVAQASGGKVTVCDDVDAAVQRADFVYTDVWLSMGEAMEKWGERIELLHHYQVSRWKAIS